MITRILSSPITFIGLLLCFGTIAFVAHNEKTRRIPPTIAGYDWAKHNEVLIIVHPLANACSSCNLSVAGWAELGRNHHLDVVVLTAKTTKELESLRQTYSKQNLQIVTGVTKETIERFSRGDKIGGVRVHKGQMIHHQIGGTPSERFFAIRS